MRTLLLFLMAGLITGCTRGDDPESNGRRAAGGPTASYARRMIFIGGAESAPTIVVFDHSVQAGAAEEERSAGLWRSAEGGWQSLLDLRWSNAPIREPWRLVPYGPFRIMVDDAGEVEALRGRGAAGDFMLARIGALGEWNRDDPILYRIDLGEWSFGPDSIAGLLVDIHPGTSPAESAAAPAELILTDGAEFRLVATADALTETAPPGELWLQRGGRTEILGPMTVARDTLPDSAGWRIDARDGELQGELLPQGAPLMLGGPERTALLALRGWIEFRGERLEVFGIMRRAAV